MQTHFEAKGAGHYGIFSGKRWREMVYPEVKEFILKRHLAAVQTLVPKAAAAKEKPAAPKPVAKKAAVKAAPAKRKVARKA